MFSLRSTASTCANGVAKLTYANFIQAATHYSLFGNKLGGKNKVEVAAFLGQVSQETSGWWAGQQYRWGLCFIEEVGCENGCSQYTIPSSEYPPVAGQSYHGRGALQITSNLNYGQVSKALFGDKNVLLEDPGRIARDGELAFRASLWFWMTAQSPKPSCHDVMHGVATECSEKGRLNGYGRTTNIINGGLECTITTPQKVINRVEYYKEYCTIFGVDHGPNLYCDTMKNYLYGGC